MAKNRTSFLLTAIAVLALGTAGTTQAAGMIIIDQEGLEGVYADWTMSTPMGKKQNTQQVKTVTINDAKEGQYVLTVDPPAGAKTMMKFFKGEELLRETDQNEFGFYYTGSGDIRTLISFSYDGNVSIDSDPQGATFELIGSPDVRYTGQTPAQFNTLPPLQYTVNFGGVEGCQRPRSQTRELDPGKKLSFFVDYQCGNVPPAAIPPAETPDTIEPGSEPSDENVSPSPSFLLSLSAQQQETVPGGSIPVLLGIRNTSRSTINDVTVSLEFDSSVVAFPDVLSEGGERMQGNLIAWHVPTIYAGQSWTVVFPVTLSDDMESGHRALLIAKASGADIDDQDGNRTQTLELGVAPLPATGGRIDGMFILFGLLAALTTTLLIRRRQGIAFIA